MSQEKAPETDNSAAEIEYKQSVQKLKLVKKNYRKLKKQRARKRRFTFILILFLCSLGFFCARYLYNAEHNRYVSEISKIAQEKRSRYATYENRFAEAITQSRENQVRSLAVSSDNTANEYIASLYRHPESKIAKLSFMDKPYYLITDLTRLDKYNLLDTTTNAIYPGAMIKGNSLFTGNNYTVLEAERTPVDLISNQTGGTVKTVSNPNYSNITLALNQYAEAYTGDTSKEWTYELQSISSSRDLNVKLGIRIDKIASLDFGFNQSNQKSTVAVVYTQIYYTVSAEPEKSASDYFKEGADLKILGSYEPAYVSSVDYGRKIILLVSGELSEQELSAKVNGLIKGVQIGAAISNVKKDEQLDLQIMTYGGADMSSVLQSSDKNKGIVGEFREWLWGSNDTDGIADRLNDFLANRDTLINPVPLSYRLKYLSDNAQVPAMYINEEEIALADNAQLITLSSSEELQVDITSLPAILLNKTEVLQQGTKITGTHIQLLCNDLETLPVRIDGYSFDLADYEMEKDTSIQIEQNSNADFQGSLHDYLFLLSNPLHSVFPGKTYEELCKIYKTKYLENIQ